MKRAIVIIIDGVGIGEMPDAGEYGDQGSNTLGNLAKEIGGLELPNLEKLGLGKISPVSGLSADIEAQACYGKLAEASPGKDSTTGHWELAGLELDQAFPTYPEGFPEEIVNKFKELTGFELLGNKPASGTEIINELGDEHIRRGIPIVYTSADSVFQIAAHEDVFPLDRLYEICQISREMLTGKHAVARVIARPFTGPKPGEFVRTKYRKDFSLKPTGRILHQNLLDEGVKTIAIGKINDLYAETGIARAESTKTNMEGMQAILSEMSSTADGFMMANLVDFDMLWGHRNDSQGFYEGLKEFDDWLPKLFDALKDNDLVMITADHGNDPTTSSTDHSREYVPLLAFGPELKNDQNLGTRQSFADMQATLADYFQVPSTGYGTSFLDLLI